MATLVTPKLLLLDEHTAALDPATAAEIDKASTMGNPEIDNQLRRAMEIAATTIKTEATS